MTVTSNELKNVGLDLQTEKRTDRPVRSVMKRVRQATLVLLATLFVLFAATQIYFYSGSREYNYDRFNANSFVSKDDVLPAGQPIPDGSLYNVNSGEFVALSALWQEKPIVVEMASITCFIFADKIASMKALQARYGHEVDFYILYGREAHPGANYTAHSTFEQKVGYATDLVALDQPERTVLVDDIDGTVHKQLGPMSNALYLVGTDGIVAHRANWNDVEVLPQEIDKLLAHNGLAGRYTSYTDLDNQPTGSRSLGEELFRVTQRSGSGSLFDVLSYIPTIIARQLVS
ncbi:hypothetical protein KFU94_42390 [Chloroflexi bacterium TSY]|nr:hypothetical protein [Chloroflexi bacterium TSY]